jgi:ABC-type polysaccharide/polyol phosphate transport system ATPase subunit
LQARSGLPNVFRSVGNIFLGPANAIRKIGHNIANPEDAKKEKEKRRFTVLKNISGVIKPGTLTLLLAPPGHGKSAYLKAITKQLPEKQMTGEVRYSGSVVCYLPGHAQALRYRPSAYVLTDVQIAASAWLVWGIFSFAVSEM